MSNYGGADAKTTSQDSRVYTVHGAAATMAGQGKLLVSRSNGYGCGPTTEGWSWKGGGAVTNTSVVVDDGGVSFGFPPVDLVYTYSSSGKTTTDRPCDSAVTHPSPAKLGTGIGQFGWNKKGKRGDLLRSSGSTTISGSGGGNPNALPGSLSYPATITVTWNLKRIGLDKDHDGLSDQGDPHPNDPDADNDGYPDGWERDHGTDPNNPHSHPDGGWSKGGPDSDGDGYSDAVEIQKGTNPRDKTSYPHNVGPDSTHVDPKSPKPPRGGGEQHGWAKHRYVRVCPKNFLLKERCIVVLSPIATATAAPTWLQNTAGEPTLDQARAMCTKLLVIPNVQKCALNNILKVLSLFNQIAFAKAMNLATTDYGCFYFEVSRTVTRIPGLANRYGEWSLGFSAANYRLVQGETHVFLDKSNVRCGVRPGGRDQWVYLEG